MSAPATNIAEFTVTELSFALKRTVEDNFEHVRVRGEISGFKGVAGSGHCYFRLKDDRACLEAVIWKTALQRMRFKPQEGLEMVATGKLTTYPGRSNYQIVVEHLEPAGAGALMALLEDRRRKLQAEGLFDPARKKPIPFLPRIIGVVTSPGGAVIRDILHRLRDRFPTRVLIWPVRVQGEGAAEEIAAAVRGFNALAADGAAPRPDLLIVARGGGSIEDLWVFNEETAVRAVADSAIPVIAAIGHETDWTLVDHAADLRAPTPTGAAEMAVPVRAELAAAVRDLSSRHELALRRLLDAERRHYVALCRALPGLASLLALPRQRLDEANGRLARSHSASIERPRRRFDEAAGRLGRGLAVEVAGKRRAFGVAAARFSPEILTGANARRREQVLSGLQRLAVANKASLRDAGRDRTRIAARLDVSCVERIVARHRERVETAGRLLLAGSPTALLARGYALVTDAHGSMVRSSGQVGPGDRLVIRVVDGSINAVVAGDPRGAESTRSGTRRSQVSLNRVIEAQGRLI